jgi:hypothetical protein
VKPRLISEKKPLRPVRVAVVRTPIQVTKPFAIGEASPVARLPFRPTR